VCRGMRSATIAILFAVWSWYDSRFGWKAAEYMLGLMEVMAIAGETRSHCSTEVMVIQVEQETAREGLTSLIGRRRTDTQ
ncbi:unnamed protein product, partial [Rangifer tarandus platyrhynchus]